MFNKDYFRDKWSTLAIAPKPAIEDCFPNHFVEPQEFFDKFIFNEPDLEKAEERLSKIEKRCKELYEEEQKRKQELLTPLGRLRAKRDMLLKQCDYTQLSDAPVTSDVKKLYKQYRQHLRDLPHLILIQAKLDYKVPTFEEWLNLNQIKIVKG